jgi:truncated hemoglobin YjbI
MQPDAPRQDSSSNSFSPMPAPHKAGPILPRAGSAQVEFAGYVFSAGDPPAKAGLFALTRQIGAFLYPVLAGEAEDMAAAVAKLMAEEPALAAGLCDGLFWMARDAARQRVHILRDLVGKYDPPFNIEHRKGRAAPEIAALAPDRANIPAAGEAEHGAESVEVSEEQLRDLVRGFYDEARKDPLIGPVFARNISDWEQHFDVAQAFWSRVLRGTQRYAGSPFTPHLSLNLKPEFFDRWIELFKLAAEKALPPPAARMAIARVEHMSVCFQAGLFPPKPAQESVA